MLGKSLSFLTVVGLFFLITISPSGFASDFQVAADAEDPFQEADRIQTFQFEPFFSAFKEPVESRNIHVAQELTALSVDASRDPKFSGSAV